MTITIPRCGKEPQLQHPLPSFLRYKSMHRTQLGMIMQQSQCCDILSSFLAFCQDFLNFHHITVIEVTLLLELAQV